MFFFKTKDTSLVLFTVAQSNGVESSSCCKAVLKSGFFRDLPNIMQFLQLGVESFDCLALFSSGHMQKSC